VSAQKRSNKNMPLKSSVKSAAKYKIIITGAGGYLGSNIKDYYTSKGFAVYCLTSKETQEEHSYQIDMTRTNILYIINKINPNAIIHTAAMSSLNECEKHPELAMKINVQLTRDIVKAINTLNPNIKLIFISSDYVFDGRNGGYIEKDRTDPVTVYGKTKALSEKYITSNLKNYIICRTSGVYGRGGGNFFNFILKALQENRPLDVLEDTFFTPTYIEYLLDSIKALLDLDFKGIIHIAGKERISRFAFAQQIAIILGKDKMLIRPVKGLVSGLISKDSSLNCDYAHNVLDIYVPSIEESLRHYFYNIKYPYFYSVDSRGKFIGILRGLKWEEINYVETNEGDVRGGHYHKLTEEAFYIIAGKIEVSLTNLITNTKRELFIHEGDILIIEPYILHTFKILENSKWISMLSKAFDGKTKDMYYLTRP
jgi:dTDP-4-dehydrorhamnose reductase